MKVENKILLFIKGILMGICDLIPGISGGTIAFITGIYPRLISAVKSFSPKLLVYLFRGEKAKLKEGIKKLDLVFLLILILGIAASILIGSRVVNSLLTNYFSFTLAFFLGLILASSKIIFDHIQNHNLKNIMFGFIGFVIGVLFAFLIPIDIVPGRAYVFIGGFFAVSAMFLPGISGAFILLIMGLYEFMINVLKDIQNNLGDFLIFILGAILGALVISRIISFLFKKDQCKTLYFLLGLVIGSLGIPIKRILAINLSAASFSIVIFFLLLGFLLVIVVNAYKKVYEQKLQKIETELES